MRIGIITFHWATNYGAVLQCYALQEALTSIGHDVEIINYKPRLFDDTLWSFIRLRKFIHLKKYLSDKTKEQYIDRFRQKRLTVSDRYYKTEQMRRACNYDVIISGSDQVLNQTFLMNGEPGGSTVYYLDFGGEKTKRIMYAVSFGSPDYPTACIDKVRNIVANIDKISVRECSGKNIFRAMGRDDAVVVPDPTFLINPKAYLDLFEPKDKTDKTAIYILHNRQAKIKGLESINYVNVDGNSIEDWLSDIHSSKNMITNSFHGAVFCILFHIPFLVVLKTKHNVGMNDRFFSMLGKLGLIDRITTEEECDYEILNEPIDWEKVDAMREQYRQEGYAFLEYSL